MEMIKISARWKRPLTVVKESSPRLQKIPACLTRLLMIATVVQTSSERLFWLILSARPTCARELLEPHGCKTKCDPLDSITSNSICNWHHRWQKVLVIWARLLFTNQAPGSSPDVVAITARHRCARVATKNWRA